MTTIADPSDRVLDPAELRRRPTPTTPRPSPPSASTRPWSRPWPPRGSPTTFAIQAMTVADALAGRDVCGKAKTGSGKTLAFGVPLLQRTMAARSTEPGRPRALVLVPTRELAVQVSEVLEPLAEEAGLRIAAVYGGADIERQVKKLRRGVDVIIATPGPAHRPRRPGRAVGGRHRDPGPRRGRPHGRHGLHAPGGVGAAPPGAGPPDPAVLGHPRRRRRPAGEPVPDRPGAPRGGLAQHHRRRHGAPLPRGAPDGPGEGVRRHLPELRQDPGLRPDQAGRRPAGRAAPQGGRQGRTPSTATSARPTGSGP